MPSLSSIRNHIIQDHPKVHFTSGTVARWSPQEETVYFVISDRPDDLVALLHELGHHLSGHDRYIQDVELLKLEREAWGQAVALAQRYKIIIPDDYIEEAMDTYRDWLHKRSRCPGCNRAGIQDSQLAYRCPLCNMSWHANDARQCGLRRVKHSPTNV